MRRPARPPSPPGDQGEIQTASTTPGRGGDPARIAEAFQTALQHHQSGRFAEAERLYRQVLGANSRHADALHQMGILAYQMGRLDLAEDFFARAIASHGRQPTFHYHLGLVLQGQGKLEPAIAAYRQALTLKSAYPQAHNNLGNALMSQGKLEAAVASFERALALKPDAADAHYNLGLALQAQGKWERAAASYQRALKLNPDYGDAYNHLGAIALRQGRLDEAEAAFRRAASLDPKDPNAHFNLGHALQSRGALDEAVACYGRALQLKPDYMEAHFNLGLAHQARGETQAAAERYRQAVALKPDYADAYSKLGYLEMVAGRAAEALAHYQRAAELSPDQAEAHNNVGSALQVLGRLEAAEAAFGQALTLKPDYPEAHYNLAIALQAQGKLDAAEAAYGRALALKPDYIEAHNNLGDLLQEQGRLGEAAASYGRAVGLKPDHAAAHSNLGSALQEQGFRQEALASFERAIAANPDFARGASARLMALHYGLELSAAELLAEHIRWGDRHAATAATAASPVDRDPERRLRVGFVSGDFRTHSVAYFLEPLLQARDPAAMEVACYAEVARPDATTERLRAIADHWRSTLGLSDEALADQVRADRIDILIDLAGHTDRNRLSAFAIKPAPVQASWLGYPNTTGLAAMDYRLVDPVTDPPGVAEGWARERLVRLEGGFLCYRPPADAPEVAAPPSSTGGGIVFGSFNNPSKLSDQTVETWAAVLARVPGSRLLLKGRPFGDEAARARLEARFAPLGIDPSRLMLKAWIATTGSHLAAYGQVDIGLDPFPYNGTTTTCEALWMGVPVVVLEGDRHAGRVGASLLTHIGLSELIAADTGAYVEIAAALAADPRRLAELRQGLRPRLLASPLTDGPGFARRFEAALRQMWRRRCEGAEPAAITVSP